MLCPVESDFCVRIGALLNLGLSRDCCWKSSAVDQYIVFSDETCCWAMPWSLVWSDAVFAVDLGMVYVLYARARLVSWSSSLWRSKNWRVNATRWVARCDTGMRTNPRDRKGKVAMKYHTCVLLLKVNAMSCCNVGICIFRLCFSKIASVF